MASSAATRRGPLTADIARAQNGSRAFQLHRYPSGRKRAPAHVLPLETQRVRSLRASCEAHAVQPTHVRRVRVWRTLAVRSPRTSPGENTYMGICTDAPTNLVTGGGAQIGISPKYGASRIIDSLLSVLTRQRSRIEPQNASEVGCPARRSTWARGHVLAGFAHAYVTVGGRAGRLPAPVAPRSSDHPRRAPSFHFALSRESARASRTGTRPAGAPIPRPSASGTTQSSHSSGRSSATAGFVHAERP
ncbi:uncharacterized protein TRAVEDRAFT_41173 [Trametes versicolor FP-101664 SS1]|uniref:uncharacterized protein n=1 Tax=Trametes versicolor (strain FP-101664) TaxID=717944 RepID=UPI0004621E1E|nr:uncharacterized protein TRAVEDRAFT_41173 [Trametes versicolor FP-101664 SS1]EIW63745.1 hypothetical protein TRAVEDRAFT_41173 [Trametes versicolor FP-101664 SS1]